MMGSKGSVTCMTLDDWEEIVAKLDYAFQPIVNTWTGSCYAYEALLRGTAEAGFESIHALFDRAYEDRPLPCGHAAAP